MLSLSLTLGYFLISQLMLEICDIHHVFHKGYWFVEAYRDIGSSGIWVQLQPSELIRTSALICVRMAMPKPDFVMLQYQGAIFGNVASMLCQTKTVNQTHKRNAN